MRQQANYNFGSRKYLTNISSMPNLYEDDEENSSIFFLIWMR